ncbi:hypothetical protein D6D24_07242 [Aureobasidium pullulans]|uniref:Uncharacterized protein n=1 Tax=Aureobasidium pullulans TaxID=5580 RepID=A0A4S8VI87_AURPU|nr:hypothetical protein D6D24_07242 [Aureobasidium pullulans]
MPDVEPEEPRTFYAPDPPVIPPYDPPVHWSEVSSEWTAHLDYNRTGFHVSRLDPDNPSGCILGPPSQIPDYHPLLEKYGIQVLGQSGFINHLGVPPAMNNNIHGRLAFAWYRNPMIEKNKEIHPVLRKELWPNITYREWNLMQPSLLLASAILDDPVTLNYFHALAVPSAEMETQFHHSDTFVGYCKNMSIPDVLTEAEQMEVFRKMYAVRDWTTWSFGDCEGYYGLTSWRIDATGFRTVPASKPDTRQSDIKLNRRLLDVIDWYDSAGPHDQRYMQILHDVHVMADIQPDHQFPIIPNSAIYRTILMLAVTMVHEFIHAFSMAYFEKSDFSDEPDEPWVKGNRSNEQGHSFENYIFGGLPAPLIISIPPMSQDFEWIQLATAPFGLYTTQHWDLWDYNKEPNYDSSGYVDPDDSDSDNATGVRVKDENDPPHKPSQRYFPIPQAWCEFLFSDDSWADQVMKYGLAAIKVPKIEKWKVIRYHSGDTGYWDTGEDRWNGGDEDDDLEFSGPHWE